MEIGTIPNKIFPKGMSVLSANAQIKRSAGIKSAAAKIHICGSNGTNAFPLSPLSGICSSKRVMITRISAMKKPRLIIIQTPETKLSKCSNLTNESVLFIKAKKA